MKATELRIGNHILKNGKLHYVSYKTIRDIISQSVDDTDVYEPIQITEERLLKFGFIDRGLGDFRRSWLHLIRNSSTSFETNCFFVKIKYLHQLQNLYFALTGEELTIN